MDRDQPAEPGDELVLARARSAISVVYAKSVELGLAQRRAEPPHSQFGLDALGGPECFVLPAGPHVELGACRVLTPTAEAIIISLGRFTAFRATNADDAIAWPRRIGVGKHRCVVGPCLGLCRALVKTVPAGCP